MFLGKGIPCTPAPDRFKSYPPIQILHTLDFKVAPQAGTAFSLFVCNLPMISFVFQLHASRSHFQLKTKNKHRHMARHHGHSPLPDEVSFPKPASQASQPSQPAKNGPDWEMTPSWKVANDIWLETMVIPHFQTRFHSPSQGIWEMTPRK